MGKANKATSKQIESSPPGGQRQASERDENYDLISVLYHALQGADTITQYVRDAQDADDEELVSFFEETKAAYIERANEAKQLLAARLEESLDDEDEEDDEDDEDDEDEDDEEEDED